MCTQTPVLHMLLGFTAAPQGTDEERSREKSQETVGSFSTAISKQLSGEAGSRSSVTVSRNQTPTVIKVSCKGTARLPVPVSQHQDYTHKMVLGKDLCKVGGKAPLILQKQGWPCNSRTTGPTFAPLGMHKPPVTGRIQASVTRQSGTGIHAQTCNFISHNHTPEAAWWK